MTARILSCLIALTFVFVSGGPLSAAQPSQSPPVSAAAGSIVPTVSQAPRSLPVMSTDDVDPWASAAGFGSASAPNAGVAAVLAAATQVVAGDFHTCALTTAGGVKCWGQNSHFQLGDGTVTTHPTPVDVVGLASGVTALASGGYHTCALTAAGGVKCWGDNNFGQLGDGTLTNRSVPVAVVGLASGVIALTAHHNHTCVLTTAGGIKCWGSNGFGRLGDGTTTDRPKPVEVVGLASGATALAAGDYHTCALTAADGVKCWGFNASGQLGDGTMIDRHTPVDVVGLASGVTALAGGGFHTCALTTGGGAKCWGRNDSGQVGDGTTAYRVTPADVVGLADGVTALTAGYWHTCALAMTGGVRCWGNNIYGNLGDGTTTSQVTPVEVVGLASGMAALAAGNNHTCALTRAGGAKCWGSNSSGQLGDGTMPNRLAPVDVVGLASGMTALAAGGYHTCTLTAAGGVKCWGNNTFGQLGDGTAIIRATPGDVMGLADGVATLMAGDFHTCALTTAGGVTCWGRNNTGQLGDGTLISRSAPVAVVGLTDGVTALVTGNNHTCALTTAGGVKCWGSNASGQLGDGTMTDRVTPVDVVGLASGMTGLGAGASHTCALTAAGGVKCWGRNTYGQLGDGTTTDRLTQVNVVGLASDMTALAAGYSHTCALSMMGEAKCWGYNYYGQLGDGTRMDRLTPVDLVGLADRVTALTVGDYHACMLTTMGGAKCWGSSGYGQLGDGIGGTDRTTPVEVVGLANGVTAIAAGYTHTCAVSMTGGVKCWGQNNCGQLGVNPGWTPVGVVGFEGEPPYTLSGRVTDSDGQPLADVTITDGAGHITTSSAIGVYMFEGLAAGAYTLTPSKNGYTFSPVQRSVTAPPDATGQDFVGTRMDTPTPTATSTPTATRTRTATPTATGTPIIGCCRSYLPLILRGL